MCQRSRGCTLVEIFKALGYLPANCIAMLSSVLFNNDNESSENMQINTLFKNSLHSCRNSITKFFLVELRKTGCLSIFFFLSFKQSHSNQQCNWNATTVWKREGNFWQRVTEQLGAFFRLSIDSHSLWTQLSKNSTVFYFYSWDLLWYYYMVCCT